jgi:micrococcal nuclease
LKMNRLQLTLVVFLIAMLFPAITFAWEGKVVSVSDGDTIKVLKDGQQVKIRLAAIDCPEKKQPYGQKAKQFTADMVAGKVVKIWEIDTDRYGRIVGFVFIGDKNLNKELLRAGLAWHYKQYSRDPEMAKLKFQARSAKRGLWAAPYPMAPWVWWRKKRQ